MSLEDEGKLDSSCLLGKFFIFSTPFIAQHLCTVVLVICEQLVKFISNSQYSVED